MNGLRTILSLAGLAALPLLASTPSQETGQTGQPPTPEGEYDWREQWPGRAVSDSDRLQMTRGLQGLWRLIEFDVPGRFTPARGERGYMLVSGNHLSMEIHGGWYADEEVDPNVRGASSRTIVGGLTQSGIHTFEISEWGKLVTHSLIGTKSTVDGNYEFEPPRTERQYDIDVAGARVVMRGDDGRTLAFQRMRQAFKRTDLFGRPTEDEVIEGKPAESIKRDIYGRPIKETGSQLPPLGGDEP